MLANYLKISVRALIRQKIFTTIILIGLYASLLAIGIACLGVRD